PGVGGRNSTGAAGSRSHAVNWQSLAPLAIVLSSLLPGLWIFFLKERQEPLRSVLNLAGAGIKVSLVILLLWGVWHGRHYELRFSIVPGIDFALIADPLAMLFVTL